MDYDAAIDFLAEWEAATDIGTAELLGLYQHHDGPMAADRCDRISGQGRILKNAHRLEAESVLRRWENQQEKGAGGRPKNERLAQAEAYALALIQHTELKNDKDTAATIAAEKYTVNPSSVRRYLQGKGPDSLP